MGGNFQGYRDEGCLSTDKDEVVKGRKNHVEELGNLQSQFYCVGCRKNHEK